jgi:proline dehydrogenase
MPFMRSLLIALARSQALQNAIVRIPVSRRMARRFVAGETLQDAIAAVQTLNAQGLCASLDHLGENVTGEAEATAAADEYLQILPAIHAAGLECNVSVKLTQMGLDVDEDFCYANVSRIVRKAAELGNFVRIDMEGSAYTERTLSLYRRLCQEQGEYQKHLGIVIQAYLRRSSEDVAKLIVEGNGRFRLCKGAYDEPPEIAYQERAAVTQALCDLTRMSLAPEAVARGVYAGIASHDEDVINFARDYAYQGGVPATAFEFQMLYGIRRELQLALVRQSYKVRVYVPYGTHWYPYFMRRLAERPANLFFFLRAFVGD